MIRQDRIDVVHVLVVDDDPDIRALFSGALAAAGLTVDTAEDGADALERLEEYRPELIIADVQMPRMNGYQLCRTIRARGIRDVPFFFCSALGSLPQRIEGLRLGADDYLVKPVDLEELVMKVSLQLEKNQQLREAREGLAEEGDHLRGRLGDLEVYQIIQLASELGKLNLKISIEPDDGPEGAIHLQEGELVDARFGDTIGRKALIRILDIGNGRFKVESAVFVDDPSLSGRPDQILLGAMAELDEYELLRRIVDEEGGWLTVAHSDELFSRWLDDLTLTLLGLIDEYHDVEDVLDRSPVPDADTLRRLVELQHLGTVRVQSPPTNMS